MAGVPGRAGAACDARRRAADCRHAWEGGTVLRGANLRNANLKSANLYAANLQGADLQDADLQAPNLWGANLRGAQFSTNIRDCSSFSYAKFTPDALPWLILHPRWAELKDTVRIEVE